MNEGPGAFATNFAFAPAYNNGSAPYGTWTAETRYTTSGWANSGDFNVDAAFAVMNENGSGQSLTQVVGGYPIAFNLSRGLSYTAYGYPAASPFNGETMWSCSGTVVQDTFGGSQDQGLSCDMTGGSSGGGGHRWLAELGDELRLQRCAEHPLGPVLRVDHPERLQRGGRGLID